MKQSGFTAVEIMIVLGIISTLTILAVPSMTRLHGRSVATSGINWIIGAINYTRHAAIIHRVTVTLCPSSSTSNQCEGRWHDGVIIFADHNRDAIMNGKDYLIERVNADNVKGKIYWRAFRNRQYLQMTKMGYTNFQNGNFVYCPLNEDLHFARQIVINTQGRIRSIHRKTKTGLRTDRKGKLLRC